MKLLLSIIVKEGEKIRKHLKNQIKANNHEICIHIRKLSLSITDAANAALVIPSGMYLQNKKEIPGGLMGKASNA